MSDGKIALISVHSDPNYGSMLQAYALSAALNRLGYINEYINYSPNKERSHYIQSCINLVKKCIFILHGSRCHVTEYSYWKTKEFRKQRKLFSLFHDKYIRSSPQKYNKNTISKSQDVYRKFFVGSDQTWSQLTTKAPYNLFFLDFVKDPYKKASYAPSIGSVSLSQSYLNLLSSKLRTFSFLSCREKQNADTLTTYIGRKVFYVLDPTFLLSKGEWLKLSEFIKMPEDYILCYILGTKKCISDYAQRLGKEKKMPVYYIVTRPEYLNCNNALRNVSVGQFLYLLNNAKYVITDSFHGTILSINMSTNFYSFAKREQGNGLNDNDRILDFLQVIHLENRFKADNAISFEADIDYDKVHGYLNNLKKQSFEYLENAAK